MGPFDQGLGGAPELRAEGEPQLLDHGAFGIKVYLIQGQTEDGIKMM